MSLFGLLLLYFYVNIESKEILHKAIIYYFAFFRVLLECILFLLNEFLVLICNCIIYDIILFLNVETYNKNKYQLNYEST